MADLLSFPGYIENLTPVLCSFAGLVLATVLTGSPQVVEIFALLVTDKCVT